jgi:hypothetical protein
MSQNESASRSGWFSRRYPTSQQHLEAQAAKQARWDGQAEDSQEREEAARARTPQEQLKRLDTLLGKGLGAKRERKRLRAKVQGEPEKEESNGTA